MSDAELFEQVRQALAPSYVVERELGRGGMATVYLARDLKHDRLVAIKVLDPELSAVLGAERFVAEIRTTAHLQHPHILPLFDSGSAAGHLFYVMPYVEGETLRARLRRETQLPVDDAVRLTEQVASALDYAHRHGVVHRDIKPENILLHDSQALVADFGIALAVQHAGGQRITQTGLSLGTPQYMSPEQAMGEREITPRSDVYSLGSVTYEMLAGEPPFTGPNAQAIVAKVITDEPRSLGAQRRTVPPQLDVAVMRALEKLPADRFATAHEFADAVCGRTPPAAADPHHVAAHRFSASVKDRLRDPVVVVLGIVALIGLTSAALFASRNRFGESSRGGRLVRFVLSTPDSTEPIWHAIPWVAAISPAGDKVAFIGIGGRQTSGSGSMGGALYVQRLDELAARRLTSVSAALEPVFSPDGRWVAFQAGPNIERASADGGDPEPITSIDSPAIFVDGIDWAPNGDIVMGATVDGGADFVRRGLARVSAGGGQATEFLRAKDPGAGLVQPVVTADGGTVLFTIITNNGQTRRLGAASLDGSTGVIQLKVDGTRVFGVLDGTLVYLRADGIVMGAPFDLRHRRITGAPVQVLDGRQYVDAYGTSGVFMSRGGGLISERGDGDARLAWIGRSGREAIPAGAHQFISAHLSPDGRQILTQIATPDNRSDIWVYDQASKTLSRLTSSGHANYPSWMPDGKRVMFVDRDSAGQLGVWVQPADGGSPPREVYHTPASTRAIPAPDGHSFLSFTVLGDPVRVSLDSPIVVHDYVKGMFVDPRFSPDGHWVAAFGLESGNNDVYVRSYPNPSIRVQISSGGGKSPEWSPDGTKIFYKLADGPVVVATLSGVPTLHVVRRDTLVDIGSSIPFDVSRDGSRVLAAVTDPAGNGLVVVPDWRAELAARMKRR